jgi:D-threo-aldose 1-dehydrogenase
MTIDRATRRRDFVTRGGRRLSFSAMGFGSAPLGNFQRPLAEAECDATVDGAWDSGMRYFDTAPLYGFGLSEQRVGRRLQVRPRTEYLISTKVGRLFEPCDKSEVNSGFFIDVPNYRFHYDYSYAGVMRSFEASLVRIGLDAVDIVFVHDVDGLNHDGRAGSEARIGELIDSGGWRALTELREQGVIAAIGAGVNEWEPCARLLELVDPDLFLLAGRYTLLEQAPIDKLFPQCAQRGVGIIIGGPFNSGVLAGRDTFNYGAIPQEVADRVRALDAVCKKHAVPMPSAALQFVMAHPIVVSVIPGPQSVQELQQNVRWFNAPIPATFWAELQAKRLIDPKAPVPGR